MVGGEDRGGRDGGGVGGGPPSLHTRHGRSQRTRAAEGQQNTGAPGRWQQGPAIDSSKLVLRG
eukprot:COSAG02_NODE_3138_length_7298_cov_4.879289_4_plen_63_part_00